MNTQSTLLLFQYHLGKVVEIVTGSGAASVVIFADAVMLGAHDLKCGNLLLSRSY